METKNYNWRHLQAQYEKVVLLSLYRQIKLKQCYDFLRIKDGVLQERRIKDHLRARLCKHHDETEAIRTSYFPSAELETKVFAEFPKEKLDFELRHPKLLRKRLDCR
jgi:hypothetical protein